MSGPATPTSAEFTGRPVIFSASATLVMIDLTVASTLTTDPFRIPSVGHSPIPRISSPSEVCFAMTVATLLDPTSSPVITGPPDASIYSPDRTNMRPFVLRSTTPCVFPRLASFGIASSTRRIASPKSIRPIFSCRP